MESAIQGTEKAIARLRQRIREGKPTCDIRIFDPYQAGPHQELELELELRLGLGLGLSHEAGTVLFSPEDEGMDSPEDSIAILYALRDWHRNHPRKTERPGRTEAVEIMESAHRMIAAQTEEAFDADEWIPPA